VGCGISYGGLLGSDDSGVALKDWLGAAPPAGSLPWTCVNVKFFLPWTRKQQANYVLVGILAKHTKRSCVLVGRFHVDLGEK